MNPGRPTALLLAVAWLWYAGAGIAADGALRVVATTPDLADIAAAVGAGAVEATALLDGPEDPHFVATRPRQMRALLGADLLIVNGLGLEAGWLPGVRRGARNPAFGPGATRRFDASVAITPLEVPLTWDDSEQPDLHAEGNPHYLADPVNGLRVAARLRQRLTELWPEHAATFAAGEAAFRRSVASALVGEALVAEHGHEVLATRLENENLMDFLGDVGAVPGGWLGAMAPYAGTPVAQDHPQWQYFARRFRIDVVATVQPRAGVPPSNEQLLALVETMRARQVPILLWCRFVDERNIRAIARRAGSRVVPMAHQAGSRKGADGYLGAVDFNVRSIIGAL